MVENKKKRLLNSKENLFASIQAIGEREGIPLEKGVVLGEDFLVKNEKLFQKYANFFTAYPDLFLDLIKSSDSDFSLFFYQRVLLRAMMRFTDVYVTAGRATSKSFLSIIALFLQCVFIPGRKVFIVAPHKNQAAKIATQKIEEIYANWPLLKREVKGWQLSDRPGNFGKDYVTLVFNNNSQFDVVGGDGTRGLRRHGGLLDELRDADQEEIQEVVLPLMNVERRLPDNTVNPKEINSQSLVMTSAGVKSSFAYEKLLGTFVNSIISPQTSFCVGMDYRVPLMHGLLNKKFINDLKMDPSFNEASFATEYLSLWRGSSSESWFSFDKMSKYRKIKNPEWKAKKFEDKRSQFYLFGVDVGRLNDRSEVCVFRVSVNSNGVYFATLVNIITLGLNAEDRQFSIQARDLKELIQKYNPKEVIIDTNGLGISLADEMIKTHIAKDGTLLPAYGFFNNDDYRKIQPKDAPLILYSMKANGPLNSQIHGNAYSRVSSGRVRFLITEQEAKSNLLATAIGQKMSLYERTKRLLPHEATTNLFNQMANLRLKRTGNQLDIVLEQINARYPKDKYSAFAYGLWRIKELEEESSKLRRRGAGKRKLTFFTGGA